MSWEYKLADTNFVNGTVIQADWLNDVNNIVYNNRFYPEDFGAVGNGTTDDGPALAMCTAAAAAAAPSTIVLSKKYALSQTFVKYHQVSYEYTGDFEFIWIGNVSGTIVETDPTDVVRESIWKGSLKINTGSSFAGIAVHFHSSVGITAETIQITSTGTTSKCVVFSADSSGGESGSFNRNCGGHKIGSILQYGTCGKVIETYGVTPGYNSEPQVVTLITIDHIFGLSQHQYGIHLKNYTDNNRFPGMCRFGLIANNAVGVQVGDVGASGVYLNSFGLVAVDTFSGFTGRKAIVLGDSKTTHIETLYNRPEAEGGVVVATEGALSYTINHYRDTDDNNNGEIVKYQRKVRIAGEGYNGSAPVVLQDDEVAVFNIAEIGINENIYVIFHITASDPESTCGVWLNPRRSTPGAQIRLMYPDATLTTTIATGTGVLTNGSTDGVDTKFNVYAGNDGNIYIKNRRGAPVSFVYCPTSWFTGS